MKVHVFGPALLVLLCLASPGAEANTIGCGGDAFSSAEVAGARNAPRAARRGPITAAPDTLCADLSDDRPPPRVNMDIVVSPSGQPETGMGDGDGSFPPPIRGQGGHGR